MGNPGMTATHTQGHRQICVDTETTGLLVEAGHRIIELAGVEMVDRVVTGRVFHTYVNPPCAVDEAAIRVHGITQDFLADKPAFGEIVDRWLDFIHGAELIIHNAAFDMAFLNAELAGLCRPDGTPYGTLNDWVTTVHDSLQLARRRHPGQKNSLDKLCERYRIDNQHRQLHGALTDAHLLAQVYLAMTGGQITIPLAADPIAGSLSGSGTGRDSGGSLIPRRQRSGKVIRATAAEQHADQALRSE